MQTQTGKQKVKFKPNLVYCNKFGSEAGLGWSRQGESVEGESSRVGSSPGGWILSGVNGAD